MKLCITFKLTPESRGEMIDTFGRTSREFKEAVEQLVAVHNGFIGVPAANVTLRWLFESGRWD